jgi:hypothetical protein
VDPAHTKAATELHYSLCRVRRNMRQYKEAREVRPLARIERGAGSLLGGGCRCHTKSRQGTLARSGQYSKPGQSRRCFPLAILA